MIQHAIYFIYKYTNNALQQKCFINNVAIVQKKVEWIGPILEITDKGLLI